MSMTSANRPTARMFVAVGIAGVVVAIGLVVGWREGQWFTAPQGPSQSAQLAVALRSAIRDGDCQRVESLLARGADVEARDEAGETLLMQAAVNADVPTMRLLLERGADPNARSLQGDPVLARALHDQDKVQLLLD